MRVFHKRSAAPVKKRFEAVPCRIVIDASDMTCDDRVHDLFTRCRRAFRAGMRHVVIDLHAVTIADTKLVACLVAIHRMARGASVRLEASLSSAVLEITRICRLERLARELTPQPPRAS
jgi:hypothetical protein